MAARAGSRMLLHLYSGSAEASTVGGTRETGLDLYYLFSAAPSQTSPPCLGFLVLANLAAAWALFLAALLALRAESTRPGFSHHTLPRSVCWDRSRRIVRVVQAKWELAQSHSSFACGLPAVVESHFSLVALAH